MKIILLNGPPGAGKDTAAKLFVDRYIDAALVKFAEPLKETATAIYFDGNRKHFDLYDTFEKKGIPQDIFYGKSCREVQIAISEIFLKKFHGETIFGEILSRKIKKLYNKPQRINKFFVSDSGFVPEAEVLVRDFGAENITLFRIHRDGHTYTGDSRGYINLDHLNVKSHDIINIQDKPEILFTTIQTALEN